MDKEKETFNQKLRMLQTEEIKNFGFIRLHHLNSMKNISDEIWAIENVLRESSLQKKKEVRNALASYYEILRGLRFKHAQTITDMLLVFSRAITFHENAQDRKFFDRKSTWDETFLPGMEQLRTNKFDRLDMIDLVHERNLLEMKSFFDDVTTNNLALMGMLSQEIDSQQLVENRLRRDLRWAKEKYQKIHEPLQRMTHELKDWEGEHRNADRLYKSLKHAEKALKKKGYCQHMLEVANECIQQQISLSVVDRNNFRKQFSKTARDIMRQAEMKSFVYQLKTRAAEKDINLFQAINYNSNKCCRDRTDPYEDMKRSRDLRMAQYASAKVNVLPYPVDPTTMDCDMKQKAVNHGAYGAVNPEGCIRPPWRKADPIYNGDFIRERKKWILQPKNVFDQLPSIKSRQASAVNTRLVSAMKSSVGSASTIVSLFPPKSLQRITSRKLPQSAKPLKHRAGESVKEKLNRILKKAEFRGTDESYPCSRFALQTSDSNLFENLQYSSAARKCLSKLTKPH